MLSLIEGSNKKPAVVDAAEAPEVWTLLPAVTPEKFFLVGASGQTQLGSDLKKVWVDGNKSLAEEWVRTHESNSD